MGDLIDRVDTREIVLDIRIDGRWAANDFADLFEAVSDLYGWFTSYLTVDSSAEEDDDELDRFEIVGADSPRVVEIRYGSPGAIKILGIGDCLKEVRQLLVYLMDRDLYREEQRLKNEQARLATFEKIAEARLKLLKVEEARLALDKKRFDHLTSLLQRARAMKHMDPRQLESEIQKFLNQRSESFGRLGELSDLEMVVSIELKDTDGGVTLEPV